MHKPTLEASTTIKVGPDKAKAWFLALSEHPEWYQFESHAGFTFTEGEFGEPGARFQTEETFLGIRQWLKFELTEVSANRFTFYLREPIKAVWGYFELEPTAAGDTRLRLAIGSDTMVRRLFLKLPGVRTAVQRQITREVEHTRASMEAQCSGSNASTHLQGSCTDGREASVPYTRKSDDLDNRVLAHHPDLNTPFFPGLITWAEAETNRGMTND